MTIATSAAAIQASIEKLDTLFAQINTEIVTLNDALLARHEAVLLEFAAAKLPAGLRRSHASGFDRSLCGAFLHSASAQVQRFINPQVGRIEAFSLEQFSERMTALQAAAEKSIARAGESV